MGTCWYFLANSKLYLQQLSLLLGERVLFIAVEWLTIQRAEGGAAVYPDLEYGANVTRVTFKICFLVVFSRLTQGFADRFDRQGL
jgi:hypothetical protein